MGHLSYGMLLCLKMNQNAALVDSLFKERWANLVLCSLYGLVMVFVKD